MGLKVAQFAVVLLAMATALPLPARQTDRELPPAALAAQIEIDGPIGPATSDYVSRSIDKAAERNASLIILRMDTPGGLDLAMRDIIKKILASPVPVLTYVSPGGARAASAGTYILYASHIAAMAPATNVGAATPVQIGAPPGIGGDDDKEKKEGDKPEEKTTPGAAMNRKMVNDAVAYIRGLAKMRGRNEEWAEKAVRQAASLPAEEALALHVIDVVAADTAGLLKKLDGRKVNVLGREVVLETAGMTIEHIKPDWRNDLLAVITNPNVAYILLLIGIYGLIFEFSSPGAVVPGTVGAICLLLALFAFQVLPINYAGLALILLGVALMVAEAFAPSFGVLGVGGVTAFVIGSIMLMDTGVEGHGINPALIGAFALSGALLFVLALGMLIKSRRKPVVSGREELIGGVGTALCDFDHAGSVRIHSETWNARTRAALKKGERVRVTGMDGLVLLVEPYDKKQESLC